MNSLLFLEFHFQNKITDYYLEQRFTASTDAERRNLILMSSGEAISNAFSSRLIRAAFNKAGLWPVNRDRVLQNPLVTNQPLLPVPRGRPTGVNISDKALTSSDQIPSRQEETKRKRMEKARATKKRNKEAAQKKATLAEFLAADSEEEFIPDESSKNTDESSRDTGSETFSDETSRSAAPEDEPPPLQRLKKTVTVTPGPIPAPAPVRCSSACTTTPKDDEGTLHALRRAENRGKNLSTTRKRLSTQNHDFVYDESP